MSNKLTAEERKRRAAERQRKANERARTPARRQRRLDEFLDGFPALIERMLHPAGENAKRSLKNRAEMIIKILEKYTMVAGEYKVSPPELDALVAESRELLRTPKRVDRQSLALLFFELGLESQKAFDAWLRRKHEELQTGRSKGGVSSSEGADAEEDDWARMIMQKRKEEPSWGRNEVLGFLEGQERKRVDELNQHIKLGGKKKKTRKRATLAKKYARYLPSTRSSKPSKRQNA